MTVAEIAKELNLTVYTGADLDQKTVKGCYIGDLLSLAMSKVEMDSIWITIQTNVNIVAVASLAEAACIIIVDGCIPDAKTVEKAREYNITILGGEISAYDAAVKLAGLGI